MKYFDDFLRKIKNSETPNDQETTEFISRFHDLKPGITEETYGSCRTATGQSSYEFLAEGVPSLNGKTVVDLASGNGPLTEILSRQVTSQGSVIAVDFNQTELDLAKRRVKGENVKFLCAPAQLLPLEDQSVDAVFCHMALMLFKPLAPVLTEVSRVLKSGGQFAAVIPYLGSNPDGVYSEAMGLLAGEVSHEIPIFTKISWGDAKVKSREGLQAMFSSSLNFEGSIDIQNMELLIEGEPQPLSEKLIKFFYASDLLSEDGKKKLKTQWVELFQRSCKNGKTTNVRFPLSRILVRKLG